jgi:TonB family protein
MKRWIIPLALLAAAAAWGEFAPATPLYIEPLGKIDIVPGALFTDTVVLQLTIAADGTVTDVAVWSSSGNAEIDAKALEAGKKCLFGPATQDGEAIDSFYQIYYKLSSYRTREYKSAEEMAETAEKTPPPKECDDGGK